MGEREKVLVVFKCVCQLNYIIFNVLFFTCLFSYERVHG